MGKRGPTAKPNEQKRKTGNPGKRPLPELADVVQLAPPPEPPTPTRPLGPAGQLVWNRAWQSAKAWLSESDEHHLQAYCETVDDYAILRQEALRAIAPDGAEQPPGLWRLRKQVLDVREQMRRHAGDLGMHTAARSELGVAEVRVAEGLTSLMQRGDPAGYARTIIVE